MNIIRYRPSNSILDSFQNELNTLLGDSSREAAYSRWTPHVDVQTKEDKYIVYADIPGVDPKDIQVHMDGNVLSIEGERKSETRDESETYTRTERYFGHFSRSFTLPEDVAEKDIDAKCNKGVLCLIIPKTEKKKPRRIEVKEGE